jgi:hypothetical protein
MGTHQLYTLYENRIYDEFALKLIKSENAIVKKFTFKLLAQLIHNIEDCRKKILHESDGILIEETRNIFMTSSDDNLVEYSCILLQHVCVDVKQSHAMIQDEAFLRAVFAKFTTFDADILLHSFRLLNLLMSNSMLIMSILGMNEFPLCNLQIELKNDCREIRVAALESFQIISTLREHPFKDNFESDRLIEVLYEISMVRKFVHAHETLGIQFFSLVTGGCSAAKDGIKNSSKLLQRGESCCEGIAFSSEIFATVS